MSRSSDFGDFPALDEAGEGSYIDNGSQKRQRTLTEKGLQW